MLHCCRMVYVALWFQLSHFYFQNYSSIYFFLGFSDVSGSRDYFEDIYTAYERKKREQTYSRTQARSEQPTTSSFASASAKADEFRRRHAEGLKKLGLSSGISSSTPPTISYEQYTRQWQTFLQNGDSHCIPWPPIKIGDMEDLLRFVGRSLVHLRQLQVDWHPDRFFARLPSNVPRTEALTNKVTALSQFFNTAVADFRAKVEKTE